MPYFDTLSYDTLNDLAISTAKKKRKSETSTRIDNEDLLSKGWQ